MKWFHPGKLTIFLFWVEELDVCTVPYICYTIFAMTSAAKQYSVLFCLLLLASMS